jgi:hypothetical protein
MGFLGVNLGKKKFKVAAVQSTASSNPNRLSRYAARTLSLSFQQPSRAG